MTVDPRVEAVEQAIRQAQCDVLASDGVPTHRLYAETAVAALDGCDAEHPDQVPWLDVVSSHCSQCDEDHIRRIRLRSWVTP